MWYDLCVRRDSVFILKILSVILALYFPSFLKNAIVFYEHDKKKSDDYIAYACTSFGFIIFVIMLHLPNPYLYS